MLLVRTYVAMSPVHGLGLFAKEDIPKGTIIWKHNPSFDTLVTEEQVALLPKIAQENIQAGSFLWRGTYCIFCDNTKFVNHSESANLTDSLEDDVMTANRDIRAGEELLEDYRGFIQETPAKNISNLKTYPSCSGL